MANSIGSRPCPLQFLLFDNAYALQSFVSGSPRLLALILQAIFKIAALLACLLLHPCRLIEAPSNFLAPLLHGLPQRLVEKPVHDVNENEECNKLE